MKLGTQKNMLSHVMDSYNYKVRFHSFLINQQWLFLFFHFIQSPTTILFSALFLRHYHDYLYDHIHLNYNILALLIIIITISHY